MIIRVCRASVVSSAWSSREPYYLLLVRYLKRKLANGESSNFDVVRVPGLNPEVFLNLFSCKW